MKKANKKSNKGFTLVELIVVIAILAVLAVGAVVAYTNIASQAEEAALRADAVTVVKALNTYNALGANGLPITSAGTDAAAFTTRLQGLQITTVPGIRDALSLRVSIDEATVNKLINGTGSGWDKAWIEYSPNGVWVLVSPLPKRS